MDLLKSIDVFREVCRQMSFSRAAYRLNLVPSAVSRQVGGLEKHLGVRLLQRTTRSISLTHEGRRYLEKMDAISHGVRELRDLGSDDERIDGHIRLTAPPVFGPQFLIKALDGFLHAYPQVSVSTTLVNRDVDLVEEGYDIALRVGNLQDSDMVARTIGEFSLSVIASPGYLEAQGEPKHPRDLVKHNCLINTLARSPRRWRFLQGTREFTVKVDGKYEVNDDLALRHFAGSGLGIAYLPSYFVHDRVNNGELTLLLQRFALEPLPISLIYPSRQWLTPAKRALVEHLIKGVQPRVFAETPAGYRHGRC